MRESFFLCLIFANWRNFTYLVLHIRAVFGHFKLRVHILIIYKIPDVENGFFVILIISIFHFNLTIVKSLMKKYYFIEMDYHCSSKFLKKIKDVINLDRKVAALKNFIKICAKMLFLCFLFLNWRNMTYFPLVLCSMHFSVFDYFKLGLRNKLVVYKLRAVKNEFSSFSVILFLSFSHKFW